VMRLSLRKKQEDFFIKKTSFLTEYAGEEVFVCQSLIESASSAGGRAISLQMG